RGVEPRPAEREDRLLERRPSTPDVVGRDDLVPREDRADLDVQRVELGAEDRERHREPVMHGIRNRVLLELDLDPDRQVAAVRVRPALHLLEALDERHALRLEVDVLHVEHLEPRLPYMTLRRSDMTLRRLRRGTA